MLDRRHSYWSRRYFKFGSFVCRAVNGDYRLSYCSPAIDVGSNAVYRADSVPDLSAITTDLDDNPRIYNGTVDLGAYEFKQLSVVLNADTVVLSGDTIIFYGDTVICYGDTARISIVSGGTPPLQFVYTKDNGTTYDTVKTISDSWFHLQLNPSETTIYKFVELRDNNCAHTLVDSIQVKVIVPLFTNSFSDDTLCSGEKTKSIVFLGHITSFAWNASGDSIDDIPLGMQTGHFGEYRIENKGNIPLTTHITATPTYRENGKTCVGIDTTFSITVYPIATLTTPLQNATLCDEETTEPVTFAGDADFYEWTATGTVSGLPTGVQRGDFGAYTVTNKTTNPTKSIITVTPKYLESREECETNQTFEIVVNPTTKIESLVPESKTLSFCEEKEVIMEVSASGKDLVYQWYFNGMPLPGEQNDYFILPSVSEQTMGTYYVEVSGACGNDKSRSITIEVEKIKVLVDKWNNDEILVDNSSRKFTAYQWYKNGLLIPGATKQFYKEKGGLHGCYGVELTLTNRSKTFACERCFDKAKKIISVYPNPAKSGEIIKVDFSLPPNGYVRFVRAELYTANGQLIMQQQIDNDSFEIETVDLSAGVYVLKMIMEDFWVYEEKVGVY